MQLFTNTRWGTTQESKNTEIKKEIIPEFISGSSTYAVAKQPLPRQALKALKRFQGLSSLIMARGFTLIELLVVVLIIALLAAVALPQYQVAVGKTRLMRLVTVMSSVKEAEEYYYLSHGTYTTNWAKLDLQLTADCPYSNQCTTSDGQTFVLTLGSSSSSNGIKGTDVLLPGVTIATNFTHSGLGENYDERILCYADTENSLADKICQTVGKNCVKPGQTLRRCYIR